MSVNFEWGKSWLGVYLTQRGISPALVRLCEEKLVVRDGFSSPLFFTRVNFQCPFFGRTYLHRSGITALGLCEELLCLHQDLVLELDKQMTTRVDVASAAAVGTIILNDGTSNKQHMSWLKKFLAENNASDYLINLCEENLVQKGGFGNPIILARISNQFFHRSYLNGKGIIVLGVREELLAFHSDLQNELVKHAPFHTGVEDAARTAVMAVLTGYSELNRKCTANQTEEMTVENTTADVRSDPVQLPIEQDWATFEADYNST